ncbi:hypothetical protein [Streptomyces melanogenes]|uniref:Integral membrane protein n=1 Tax=Streptomyces melanogenes TaxID=67326 RepID=A0ABZ1XBK0_9ACTN|nr:hypothetical protein [Streptomyces melanogenes]
MNTFDHTSPVEPRWRGGASRKETVLFRLVWCMGAALVIASLLLIAGACAADTMAGESGQPAGVLGAIGLCLGAILVVFGLLAHGIAQKPGRR